VKILFLDDMPERHEAFNGWVGEMAKGKLPIVAHAYNAKDAISWLETGEGWDLIFLDHDLGEQHYMDRPTGEGAFTSTHDGECGCEVMQHIITHGPWDKPVIVHSYNAPAAKKMVNMMLDALHEVANLETEPPPPPMVGWVPFGPSLKKFL